MVGTLESLVVLFIWEVDFSSVPAPFLARERSEDIPEDLDFPDWGKYDMAI